MNEIGTRIKELMEQKGVSYRTLAYKTNIPKSALQRYVSGETEKIPINRIELIADVLNVTAATLMGWEEQTEVNTQDNTSKLIELVKKVKPEDYEIVRSFLERLID